MNKKIIGLAVLVVLGFASCHQFMKAKQTEEIPTAPVTALPQDPSLQVYFNQSIASSYSEPYRQVTRPGDDLEQQIVQSINSARSSVDVAVEEFRLPRIAQALVHSHRSGIKVRLIVENTYNRPLNLSAPELAALSSRERERYAELVHLASVSGDALAIVPEAGIPVIDDTADGSKGSGLMHHKFVVIDGKTVIVTSANFTTSDIHGDFKSAESRGNPNNLLKLESPLAGKSFQRGICNHVGRWTRRETGQQVWREEADTSSRPSSSWWRDCCRAVFPSDCNNYLATDLERINRSDFSQFVQVGQSGAVRVFCPAVGEHTGIEISARSCHPSFG